jgi:endonuclease III
VQKRVKKILAQLRRSYPDARCSLNYKNPVELMVATILSAQCTDVRVNLVTKELFKKYRKASDFAEAPQRVLEKDIRSTGFYRNKAKSIRGCCAAILKQFGGKVPNRLEDLVKLPGVGRKTANVVLGNAYGIPGITVDTHVKRIANRLGWTNKQDPVKIEFDLMPIIPKKEWTHASHLLIQHGRRCCTARKPNCTHCPVETHCPYPGK